MIHIILYISESMGEKFFLGAIQGLIGCVILYFWLRRTKKKEKKQYEKELKEEIYHDFSHQTTISNNAIEVDYYGTLYDELKEKCNPANYMNPYNAEKVEISNQIYSQLDTNKNNISVLIELRNQAIKKLGLSFSAKELYDKLCEIYNPNNYVGEKYDSDKLHVANQIYAKIQSISTDIIGLENVAKENGITLIRKKNFESQHKVVIKQDINTNNTDNSDNSYDNGMIYLLTAIVACLILFIALATCVGKQNSVAQNDNDLFIDSLEVIDSMASNDDAIESELPTNTFSNGIYSIQYPKDWILTKSNSGYTDVYIKAPNSEFSFQIIHYSIDKSLDEIQDVLDANLVKSGFDIVEKQDLTISGHNAYGRIYFKINENGSIMNGDTETVLMVYNLKRNGVLYNIKFYSRANQENEDIARTIISTFKFHNS